MSVDIFLKLSNIDGDATADKFAGWINVLTFSWGATQTTTTVIGGGGSAGKVQVQDFSFVKEPDSASPKLFQSVCSGQHIPDAQLSLVKSGGSQQEFMKIKMTNVLISSFQSGGSAGMVPAEQVSFSFDKLELSTAEQRADGSIGGWETHVCDFVKNTSA